MVIIMNETDSREKSNANTLYTQTTGISQTTLDPHVYAQTLKEVWEE